MSTTKLNIGKIPISKGEYQEGTAYQRLNQVTMLGSTYQSKIDDNTSAPAQMGADGAVENINTDKWICIAVGNVSAAKKVVYNNETSGLEAGNVQEAIDETNTKFRNLSELSRFYKVNLFSIQNLYDNNTVVPLFGLYYSLSAKSIVPCNISNDSYCIKVIEGASYIMENITCVGGYGFADYPFLGTKETPIELGIIKNRYTVPQGVKYVIFNVAVKNIQENPKFYSNDGFATKSTAFTKTYKDAERSNIKKTGTYINSGTTPAILFVKANDTDNSVWQYEITTAEQGSPQIRVRDWNGSSWNEWSMLSIYEFMQEYREISINSSLLNEIDRLHFHRLLLKPGYLSENGEVNLTEYENCFSFLLGVKEGDIIGYTNGYHYAFLKNNVEFLNKTIVPLVDGTKRMASSNKDDIIIPATCNYLWISGHYQSDVVDNNDYQPDTITINGITYTIEDGKEAAIPNLIDRVGNLEKKYPKGILKYSVSDKTFQFFMYKGISNLYFSITMKLMVEDSDDVYLKEYRWIDGGLYSYTNGTFERIASTMIGIENEMAMKFNDSTDYTGGAHGDERIDIDPKSFAHFFADGLLLSEAQLSKDFTMECSEFSYIQLSTLHETKGITSKEDSEHPIIAHHLKHNIFKNCASFLDNTIKFDIEEYDYSNLKVDQYHATMACVAKDAATTTLLPDFVVVDTSKGSNQSTLAKNSNNAKTIQWNDTTGIKVLTEGHFTEGLSDDMKNNPSGTSVFMVWDRTSDSKIYRRYHNLNKTITKGYTLRNHQEIHFS